MQWQNNGGKVNYKQQLAVVEGLSIPPDTEIRHDCPFCHNKNTLVVDTTNDICQPIKSINSSNIHPIQDFNNKLYSLTFTGKLGIIAIHDNYKPWSKINSYNGKIVINDSRKQIVFIKNCFSHGNTQGAYLYSIYKCVNNKCTLIRPDKNKLLQKFESCYQIESTNINYPIFYSLHKSENNVLNNLNYFIEYLQTNTL